MSADASEQKPLLNSNLSSTPMHPSISRNDPLLFPSFTSAMKPTTLDGSTSLNGLTTTTTTTSSPPTSVNEPTHLGSTATSTRKRPVQIDHSMNGDGKDAAALSTKMKKLAEVIRRVDLFPKAEEEVTVDSNTGILTTVITFFIITLLFMSQLSDYLTVRTREHMVVDTQQPGESLKLAFDVTFHSLRCSLVNLDFMDITGAHKEDIQAGVLRQRLSPLGAPIGDIIDERTESHDEAGEGCRVRVSGVELAKVGGNLHIAVGGSGRKHQGKRHVHVFQQADLLAFNASHTFHSLRFGEHFHGQADPMAGVSAFATEGPTHFKYFLKVLPTTFEAPRRGVRLESNQYSMTEVSVVTDPNTIKQGSGIPGLFITYEFSSFRVKIIESSTPLSTFLINVCAIIGGAITILGIVDSLVYHLLRWYKDKSRG